ncbi:MAG: hypothetical protein QOJ70_3721 [Acidobacteriota bacterium]|nr:hypothetical protein [Acidobacteriota bacterium]
MESATRQPDEESARESDGDEHDARPRSEETLSALGRFDFERGWLVVACALLVVSAALLYVGRPSAAFVTAALGVSAWFLNVRTGLKRKHNLVKRGGRNWEPRGRDEE